MKTQQVGLVGLVDTRKTLNFSFTFCQAGFHHSYELKLHRQAVDDRSVTTHHTVISIDSNSQIKILMSECGDVLNRFFFFSLSERRHSRFKCQLPW